MEQLHPVAQLASNLLEKDGDSVGYPPAACRQLAQAYAKTFGTKDVVTATQDLLKVAAHLRDKMNAPQAGATLVLLTFCAKDELEKLHEGHLARLSGDMAKRGAAAAALTGAEPMGLPMAPTTPKNGASKGGPMARHKLKKK